MPACSTCGLAVEWTRSCYSSSWHLFPDDPTIATNGRYYFAEPETPFFSGAHNLGSREWHDRNWRLAVVLGEDADCDNPWNRGDPPPLLPKSEVVGGPDCITQGPRRADIVPANLLVDGFPALCFPPCRTRDEVIQDATGFDSCVVQRFYANVIVAMYDNDPVSIVGLFNLLLGPLGEVSFRDEVGSMPAVVTVKTATCSIVVLDGTRSFEQLAEQALTSIRAPTNVGNFGTVPLWFVASSYVNAIVNLDALDPELPIFLVGHSYGGAAALVLAARYRFARPERTIRYLTFGTPKPGDQRLRDLIDTCDGINLINDTDLIAVFPPDLAELLPVMIALAAPQLIVWTDWIRPGRQAMIDTNGNVFPNQRPIDDFTTLSAIALLVLAGAPLTPFSAHPIAEYLRRLTLRCPEDNVWPLDDLCIPDVPVPDGELELVGGDGGAVQTAVCFTPMPKTIPVTIRNYPGMAWTSITLPVTYTPFNTHSWSFTCDAAHDPFGVLTGSQSPYGGGLPWSSFGVLIDVISTIGIVAGCSARDDNGNTLPMVNQPHFTDTSSCEPLGYFVEGLPRIGINEIDCAFPGIVQLEFGDLSAFRPVIAASDADICLDAMTIVIEGAGFVTSPPSPVTVRFPRSSASGRVTSLAANEITVTLDYPIDSFGPLMAIVANRLGSSEERQVGNVIDCTAGLVWLDDFAATDGTDLPAHAPIMPAAGIYTASGGTLTIIGNKVEATALDMAGHAGVFFDPLQAQPTTLSIVIRFDSSAQTASFNIFPQASVFGSHVGAFVSLVAGNSWLVGVADDIIGNVSLPVTLLADTDYTLDVIDDGINVSARINGITATLPLVQPPLGTGYFVGFTSAAIGATWLKPELRVRTP